MPRRLLDELGVVPSYYLRYFYAHDEVLREQLDGVPRAQAVAEIERELLRLYRDPHLVEKPALLEQRGGAFYSEAALGLVASLVSGDGAVHEVDVRNAGDARRACRRRRGRGACASDRGPAPSRSSSRRSRRSCSASRSTSRPTSGSRFGAALSRDVVDVKKALLAHPLIAQYAIAEQLLERMAAEVLA